MAASAPIVDLDGLRRGDPHACAALCVDRGAAVLACCATVTGESWALAAAAEALGQFREELDARPHADLDALLLACARRSALARTPRPLRAMTAAALAGRFGARNRRAATCGLLPELLVARADGELSAADHDRLERHLDACTACRSLAERFDDAARAYCEARGNAIPSSEAAAALLAALDPSVGSADAAAIAGDVESQTDADPAAELRRLDESIPFDALPPTGAHPAPLPAEDEPLDALPPTVAHPAPVPAEHEPLSAVPAEPEPRLTAHISAEYPPEPCAPIVASHAEVAPEPAPSAREAYPSEAAFAAYPHDTDPLAAVETVAAELADLLDDDSAVLRVPATGSRRGRLPPAPAPPQTRSPIRAGELGRRHGRRLLLALLFTAVALAAAIAVTLAYRSSSTHTTTSPPTPAGRSPSAPASTSNGTSVAPFHPTHTHHSVHHTLPSIAMPALPSHDRAPATTQPPTGAAAPHHTATPQQSATAHGRAVAHIAPVQTTSPSGSSTHTQPTTPNPGGTPSGADGGSSATPPPASSGAPPPAAPTGSAGSTASPSGGGTGYVPATP